ncbi:hypothetical protein HOP50_11g63340 [Chloropicon primus]|uniref:Uncharacterized protein n=1 Tax=Chloropicon primus TaxID=1764295 RepID=A0A5B8MVQ8_9CHLO|nr:hypothetical protein A3770_11p63120 [Chloropicon primus]UPR03007.1 hypothetical protein HOP50_11g63340 [Chloropicon primus]|eukprot:QDZ23794.1 hypothetical protein A3770_11p63120 [Chloropicon primus]
MSENALAAYFLFDASPYALNEDVYCQARSMTRWCAQVQAARLIALDLEPDVVGLEAGEEWLITPARDWKSQLAGLDESFSPQRGGKDSNLLDRMIKRLLLVMKMNRMKSRVYLFLCGDIGDSSQRASTFWDSAKELRKACGEVSIIAFGESMTISSLSDLHDVCRCKGEDEGSCLYPFACEKCSTLLVIPPTWDADARCPSADFFGALVRNSLLSQNLLFGFASKWEEAYGRKPPGILLEALEASKVETHAKRMTSIRTTLSSYYASFPIDKSRRSSPEPPVVLPEGDDNQIAAAGLRPHGDCGRQAKLGDNIERGMLDFSLSSPGLKTALPLQDVTKIFTHFLTPVCRVRVGKLLKSFGKSAGNLQGTMKLSPSRNVGRLEFWLQPDSSCTLTWRKEGDPLEELLLRMPHDRTRASIGISKLPGDPSGRSFALVRKTLQGKKTPMHCFYTREASQVGEKEINKLIKVFENPPTVESTMTDSQLATFEILKGALGLVSGQATKPASAGERGGHLTHKPQRLATERKSVLEAQPTSLGPGIKKGFLGRRAKKKGRSKAVAEGASSGSKEVEAAAAPARPPSPEHNRKFFIPGAEAAEEHPPPREEGVPAGEPTKPAPGGQVSIDNLKDLFGS